MYFDFFNSSLKNFYTNSEINWPVALLYSYWDESDAADATPTDLTEDDDDDASDSSDDGDEIFFE